MPSINDWAAKAADRIINDSTVRAFYLGNFSKPPSVEYTTERIAAIIALHAEPLMALLRETRREHNDTDEGYCPRNYPDHWTVSKAKCICGADAWNVRIDAALAGEKFASP